MTISVIIPTFNEACGIRETLTRVRSGSDVEVIVSDGGSSDGTPALARDLADRVVASPPGRGRQMNTGVRACRGDILLFLHADTLLPPGWDMMIREIISDGGIAGGAFDLGIASERPGLAWIARAASWRSRLTRVPYGDQAPFVRRTVFEAIGGYPEIPIMEDVAFARKLKRAGRIRFIARPVSTSARRWENEGVLFTTLRNWAIVTCFLAGVAPERLARWYRDVRAEKGA